MNATHLSGPTTKAPATIATPGPKEMTMPTGVRILRTDAQNGLNLAEKMTSR